MTRPDLTLVHGWGMHGSIWSPCLDALRVVANVRLADLPGYGGTPDVNGAFADAARSLVAPIGETETGDRVTLCGWSLGALLAMQAALLVPERVEKLILVAATPRFTQQAEWNEAQPASLLDDFAAAVADDRDATLQRFAHRQRFLQWMLADILRAAVSRRALVDTRVDPQAEIRILAGDISARDNQSLAEAGSKVAEVAQALYAQGLIDKDELLRLIYRFLGEGGSHVEV